MSAFALIPGYLRLGPLRLPVFGVVAAAGLIAALWLSQRTARRAGLQPERLWDAGMFALLSAFLVSRLLLVARDPAAFWRFPLLVLTLPSLTYGGIFLTALLTGLWLRWKRLPLLDVLDAWAPCGALLWAVLSLGHYVEGTDAGMPTTLPWGIITPGDTMLGRVHPVQIYTAMAALLLCAMLIGRLAYRKSRGVVVAFALMAGGAASFLLDMLRQPLETNGDALLDITQWFAIAAMLGGSLLAALFASPIMTRADVADFIECFIHSKGTISPGPITNAVFSDPLLVDTRQRFLDLPSHYPSTSPDLPWCNPQGLEVLSWYIWQLRGEEQRRPEESF